MTRTRPTQSVPAVRRIAGVVGAALIGVGALLAGTAAFAQSPRPWIDRAQAIEKLASEYGERTTALGLASNGGVVELLASPGGGSWTMLLTMPNGLSRVIIVGESWTPVAPLEVAGHDS